MIAHHAIARRSHAGFTLLELLVTLAIFGTLIGLAVPQFYVWTQSAKLRSVAESLQNALRLAQGEAVRRSHSVKLSLISAPGTTPPVIFTAASSSSDPATSISAVSPATNWMAYTVPVLASDTYDFVAGGDNGNLESPVKISGPASLTFTPFGRLSGVTTTQTYSITNSPGRALNVTVTVGGQVRLCDPNRSITSSPDGC